MNQWAAMSARWIRSTRVRRSANSLPQRGDLQVRSGHSVYSCRQQSTGAGVHVTLEATRKEYGAVARAHAGR